LGVRVTNLAEVLARRGFETRLFFVGDPSAPGYESRLDGRLILHRWCQWISAYHPTGVYEAEDSKMWDFNNSAPPFIIEHVIRPALAAGRLPVIMAEEWQTAEALLRLDDQLRDVGLHVTDVNGQPTSWDEMLGLLRSAGPADVYNLRFHMSQDMLCPFYAAADAVLANSGHEPFGLVGLEAMADGGGWSLPARRARIMPWAVEVP